MNLYELRAKCEEEYNKNCETGEETDWGFSHEDMWIINPWLDSSGMGTVDPIECYGTCFTDFIGKKLDSLFT